MDTKELTRGLRGIVRAGRVSSVYPERMTARVVFDEKDQNVTYELPVMNRCALRNKDYWLPDVGDPVVCLFAQNDKNLSSGWILGTFFNDGAPPQIADKDKRRLDFSDGTFIEYDRAKHRLEINCVGNIYIRGKMIYLN
ncbi:MAG: phage baseplate assembly protein V [Schwartzia sp.]|nr:phage baseplate assembly protein V [Schwartzia sp. (in: firmicutes)]